MIGEWSKEWGEKKEGLSLYYFSSLASTNSFGKEKFESLSYPNLITCDEQYEGRGRRDNQWLGLKKGNGFYSTWSFQLSKNLHPSLSIKIGLALRKSLSVHWPQKKFTIKPPNDIYLNGKKLGGILLESISSKKTHLFIGIGLNILEKPDLDNTCLLDKDTTKEIWQGFLNELYQNLLSAVESKEYLNSEEKECLKLVIQPHFQEQVLEVSKNGDIILENKKIDWQSL